MDPVLEIEMFDELGEVIGVGVKVVALLKLARPAVPAAVMGDATIAVRRREEHLVFKSVSGQPWLKTTGWPVLP
jgi:hypothetical protein